MMASRNRALWFASLAAEANPMLGDRWRRIKLASYSPTAAQRRRWRWWRRRHYSADIYKLLKRIESAPERTSANADRGDVPITWLLPYRADLRRVYAGYHPRYNEAEVDIIRCYMANCPADMIPLCIWLLGKCADRFRLYGIAGRCDDPSPKVRKQVAKALRRTEAWSVLEKMARAYPNDEKVQWFAKAELRHRPFPERLSSFVRSVDDSHAGEVTTPSRMPFWARENSWDYTPPKSVELIRRMLRRIRHWVRWGVN